jgi:quercetin dioxygenase-like cupin family protein
VAAIDADAEDRSVDENNRLEAKMIIKADGSGYNEMVAGVRLKSMVHGATTHLTEVRFVKGAVVPEHRHPHEQTGYLVSGSLRFFGNGVDTVVNPGDCWNFASNVPHGAEALDDSVVIEVFSPIREDYLPESTGCP